MTDAIAIRPLEKSDFDRVHEIDLSEDIRLTYRWADAQLRPEPRDVSRPRWDRAAWQEKLRAWRIHHPPDVWLGAFAGQQMVALASLRYGLAPGTAQLTSLHVNRGHRRLGLARQLLERVTAMAEESGANALYVSAAETESAVVFYLSQGFQPTDTPDPRLFELEPEDIHMVRPLGSSNALV